MKKEFREEVIDFVKKQRLDVLIFEMKMDFNEFKLNLNYRNN